MYLIDSYGTSTKSFEELFSIYEEAKQWLESQGIRVNPTRFQKNKKLLEKNQSSNIDEDFNILWASAELHDLCEIYNRLSQYDSSQTLESLKKMVKGPELLSQERNDGGSIHGRNFTFELYTASRLVRAGYKTTFDTDADINFVDNGVLFHVECKRIISENNMENLINEAIKQIDNRCSNDDKGIVAISISKLVHKAIQSDAKSSSADISEMQNIMREHLGKWGQIIQTRYSKKSTNVVGLILHYKMPLRDKNTGYAAVLNRFSFIMFDNGIVNNHIAHRISESLRLSIEGS